jgi:hypothetical protein
MIRQIGTFVVDVKISEIVTENLILGRYFHLSVGADRTI